MPGFMQSLKSHLPQTPFSPTKKTVPAVTPAVAGEEGATTEEQPSSEVLPSEALIQPNSSTVALTLTAANGESSQQLPSAGEDVAALVSSEPASEDPATQASTEQIESQGAVIPIEAAQEIPKEVIVAATTQPEHPEAPSDQSADVESSPSAPVANAEAVAATESAGVEVAQLPTEEVESAKPEAPAALSEDSIPVVGEPNVAEVTFADPEVTDVKPSSDGEKEKFSGHVKRSKSKKKKSATPASNETKEGGESVPCKPRKSHPLADKFRNVIEHVKLKVKKDKEAAVISPPVVAIVEPTPNADETAVAA